MTRSLIVVADTLMASIGFPQLGSFQTWETGCGPCVMIVELSSLLLYIYIRILFMAMVELLYTGVDRCGGQVGVYKSPKLS